MKVIGVHGKGRSGKDEFANILCKSFGFTHVSFAKKIKDLAIEYFGLDKDSVEEKTKESRVILQGIGAMVRENISDLFGKVQATDKTMSKKGISGYCMWAEDFAIKYFQLPPAWLKGKRMYMKKVVGGTESMYTNFLSEFKKVAGDKDKNIWINYLFNTLNEKDVYVISDVRFKNEKDKIKSVNGYNVKIDRMDKPEIEAGANHVSEVELDNETDWDFEVMNEHKTEWKDKLSLNATNFVRKLDSLGFFSDDDKDKFRVNIVSYDELGRS